MKKTNISLKQPYIISYAVTYCLETKHYPDLQKKALFESGSRRVEILIITFLKGLLLAKSEF